MAIETGISWCDSTFNPWMGCTKVSPACDDCYAARSMPARTMGIAWGAGKPRVRTSASNWKTPLHWEKQHEAFAQTYGRRRRVFCASLADVFDNEVDPAWRAGLFALIAQTPSLDWLLLTKRIGNVVKMIGAPGMQKCGLPPNIWLGATVINQEEADRDIPKLLAVPAAKRFLSIEPMLGPVDLCQLRGFHNGAVPQTHDCLSGHSSDTPWGYVRDKRPDPFGRGRVDWVIAGGESGPQARPMHPDWVRSLRDQCAAAGVPFHFKQWGEWAPSISYPVQDSFRWPQALREIEPTYSFRVGTKTAGRHLDGHTHNGFPS